jgi:hypothetical protein
MPDVVARGHHPVGHQGTTIETGRRRPNVPAVSGEGIEVKGEDVTTRVAVLREAMRGTTTRRDLLRRGMKAGLGFGGLAGLLAMRGTPRASAEHAGFTNCLWTFDASCERTCSARQFTCQRQGRSGCDREYERCRASCYEWLCFPDNDAGEGVLV